MYTFSFSILSNNWESNCMQLNLNQHYKRKRQYIFNLQQEDNCFTDKGDEISGPKVSFLMEVPLYAQST